MIDWSKCQTKAQKQKKQRLKELLRRERDEMQRKINATRAAQRRLQAKQNAAKKNKEVIKETKEIEEQIQVQQRMYALKLKAVADELDKTNFFDFVYRIGGEKARKQKTCGFPLTFYKLKR